MGQYVVVKFPTRTSFQEIAEISSFLSVIRDAVKNVLADFAR